jgi:hypothetical protein
MDLSSFTLRCRRNLAINAENTGFREVIGQVVKNCVNRKRKLLDIARTKAFDADFYKQVHSSTIKPKEKESF